MATHLAAARSILYRPSHRTIFSSFISRSFSTVPTSSAAVTRSASLFRTLRPLSAAVQFASSSSGFISRSFSTRPTTSSLNDPSPNWSTRPPKETILLDGCDFEHWLVVVEPPTGDVTRDDIIASYIKTLATVLGSEEEARMKIYSVSTKHYFAFGALVSEELSIKIKELPHVRWVLPDSYLHVREKDYGGEPFINGQAVPYDPKYHEEWVRNNARANERNRRNDRPRNFDRSRNFDRRRENTRGPPMNNQGMQNPPPNAVGPGGPPPANYRNGPPPPQQNMRGPPPPPPQNNYAGPPPPQNNYGPPPPQTNYGPPPPQTNYGPPPPQANYGPPPPANMGGMPPNSAWSNNMPGNFQNGPHDGGMSHQGAPSNYQNHYNANSDGSAPVRNAY